MNPQINNENQNQKIMIKLAIVCFFIFVLFYAMYKKPSEIPSTFQQSAGGSYLKLQETIDSFKKILI